MIKKWTNLLVHQVKKNLFKRNKIESYWDKLICKALEGRDISDLLMSGGSSNAAPVSTGAADNKAPVKA